MGREEGRRESEQAWRSIRPGAACFADPDRVLAEDVGHSRVETRNYCFGKVGDGIMTVRFTYRRNRIRIFGAWYWRKGKEIYNGERS